MVRVAEDLGVPLRSQFVVPTHSQRGVPVLVDDERGLTMAKSADIVAYLQRTYGDDEADRRRP